MNDAVNKDVLLRSVECFNDPARREAYFDRYSPRCFFHGLEPPTLENHRQACRELWRAFPDLRLTVEDLLVDGARIACRYSAIGTHCGIYLGVAPTGKTVRFKGISILRFERGTCVERWTEGDALGVLEQLGASGGDT